MLKRGFQFAPGYRLQEFLGRGQFGQVWRATAPGGAAMAAKFIDLSDGQGQKEYDGVRRVKQIRHANLMPITAIWLLDAQGQVIEEAQEDANETIDLSVIEPMGQSAIVSSPAVEPSWLVVGMLLGGKSLQHRLRECVGEGHPGIPPKELIAYLDESAKGLDYLNSPQHDLGEGPIAIQHSDVKPANIVLIGSSAVVCDFGLARILTRNQVTATSAAGTPAYMAPEAISGKPSCNSDQYSLAVTYYHLRTGTLPVSDGSLWEVLDAHRHGKLNLSLVPEAEQAVLRKATDLDWAKRFDSNVELVDAMREALRSEGHTKPSFVPPTSVSQEGGQQETAGGQQETAGGQQETAGAFNQSLTVDLPATDGASAQISDAQRSLLEMQSGGVAEKSTKKEGFANETLPNLADQYESTSGQRTDALSKARIWADQNRVLAATGIGAILCLLAFVIWGPSGGDAVSEERGIEETPGGSQPEVVDGDSGVLPSSDPTGEIDYLSRALEAFDSDEVEAVSLFRSALDSETPPVLEERTLHGLQGPVMKMAVSSDGARLVAMADGPSPLVWETGDPQSEPIPLLGHERLLHTFAIHPNDDRLLTAGADSTARVWELRQTDIRSTELDLEGHKQRIEAVGWHPVENLAVTASADLTLRLWEFGAPDADHPNGTVVPRSSFPVQENLVALQSDAGGRWLAAITMGEDLVDTKVDLLIYPWQSLLEMQGAPEPKRFAAENTKHISFLNDPSGAIVVSGDRGGSVSLYSAESGELVTRFESHQADVEALKVISLEDFQVIVTGSADGTVERRQYGRTSRSMQREFCASLGVSCVDVSPDGRWLAAGCGDGSVWIWDSNEEAESDVGAFRIETGSNGVDSVLLDEARNHLIVGCDDGAIRRYDLTVAKLMTLANPTLSDDRPERQIKTPQISMR
ncbi:MAG: WD40 repeat domain-containing serine/threonine protein kinase [Rubripirellula sp.]